MRRTSRATETSPREDAAAIGIALVGTPAQIEWAERIRSLVSAEFDRVAHALNSTADKQTASDSLETRAIVALLEEKRIQVLARSEAGYYIKDWQELSNQVQNLLLADSRFVAIRMAKAARIQALAVALQANCSAPDKEEDV